MADKLMDCLVEDINKVIQGKTTTLPELEALGYVKTANCINIKTKSKSGRSESMTIFEMKESDSNKRPSFSFCLFNADREGVVLPFPYRKYEKLDN